MQFIWEVTDNMTCVFLLLVLSHWFYVLYLRFEQAYLASVLGTKRGQYWTDVTDTLTPDTYQYSDGNKYLQFTNWAPNKPGTKCDYQCSTVKVCSY